MVLVLICAAFLFYTLIGYPLLINYLAKRHPISVATDPTYEPTVSVLMSVHNSARFLEAKLDTIDRLEYPREKIEILIYDDASTDESERILTERMVKDPRIRVLFGKPRRGKPAGLNQLAPMATSEVFLMTDVRQDIEPTSLRALLLRLADPTVGTVAGNLVLRGEGGSGVYWRYEEWIRDREARFRGMVGTMGSLYVIRKADFVAMPEDTILDDMWVPMRLRLEGRKLLFTKEAVAYDEAFEDDREFGRKARTLAGNYQLFRVMPALLSPRNPSFFETVSHKALRLLIPWFLLGILWGSFCGACCHPILSALLVAQLGFYGLALAGPLAGKLGRIARTFMVMQLATVVGLWRYLTRSQSAAW